ncbi:MAG: radical SAM protein [Betaproteobacteria bacterium]
MIELPALRRPRIPLVPVAEALKPGSALAAVAALARLAARFPAVALREPPRADATRWHAHEIDGRLHRLAQPITFTPYAATAPCSARCGFCSENLRDDAAPGRAAATLRPGPRYFEHLRAALAALHGVPLSYSLSGLESTDDADWFIELLHVLRDVQRGPRVDEAVLYTNGAGLVRDGARLLPALQAFGTSWIEWSRHHDSGDGNQRLMRFRDGLAVADPAAFEHALRATAARIPVKLVCIVQRGGVETVDDVRRYVRWAASLGVAGVILREFSSLPPHYRANATRRHIDAARVRVDALLEACLADTAWTPTALTDGYYFWNARLQANAGMEVVFERSDYAAMLAHEATGLVYKLVFHANAHLCAGWQPDHHVLWTPDAGR